jgi:vitamin B12 transporter
MDFRQTLFWFPIVARVIILEIIYSESAVAIETLTPIIVTASPTLVEKISNPLKLDEEDITIGHERSIADVFQGFPGISSTSPGGFGLTQTFNIRGAGGQGTVTLDGIPMLQSLPGLFNLDTLPTEAIKNAEFVRGPDDVYRSFQSLGGGIHLTTQERENTGGRFSMEGGSFGILRETLQGGASGSLGRATLTLNRGDAFDGVHLAGGANNPEREPFRFTQGILRFSSDLTDRLNWQGSAIYRTSWGGSDKIGRDSNKRAAFLDDRQSFGIGDYWLAQNSFNLKVLERWNSHFQLGFTQLTSTLKAGSIINHIDHQLYLVNWHNQYTLADNNQNNFEWQLNWGGQGRNERVTAQDNRQPIVFDGNRTMASGFLETKAQYSNLSGEIGVRLEHFDQYGDHQLFKTAAAWQISPKLILRASGGTGYRIPSYTELRSLFFGNKDLVPERSASGNVGLEWFPDNKLHLSLNSYYNRYDNLINLIYSPKAGPVSVNVPDASVAGVELDVQYTWTSYLDTGFSYTYSDNRNLHSNLQLPLRPPHIARIWGTLKPTNLPFYLWAETIIRSSTWNDAANTLSINQAEQINAAIRYPINKQFEIYLRGENLTNNQSSQFYSTSIPGIAVYGGFKIEFSP